MDNETHLSSQTVRRVGRHLAIELDYGMFSLGEYNLIMRVLHDLSKNGTPRPEITPKLLKGQEVAELLGISFSEFRKLAAEGAFPFKRRVLGKSVRFYYPEIVEYMRSGSLAEKEESVCDEK